MIWTSTGLGKYSVRRIEDACEKGRRAGFKGFWALLFAEPLPFFFFFIFLSCYALKFDYKHLEEM